MLWRTIRLPDKSKSSTRRMHSGAVICSKCPKRDTSIPEVPLSGVYIAVPVLSSLYSRTSPLGTNTGSVSQPRRVCSPVQSSVTFVVLLAPSRFLSNESDKS